MANHCCDVLKNEEFLNLSQERLIKLFQEDNLNIRCESTIFHAVCDWIRHDLTGRRYDLDNVISCVRFHLLSPKFLQEQIKQNEVLNMSNAYESREYITNVCDKLNNHKPMYSKLTNRSPSCSMYAIGGYNKQSMAKTECLSYNWKWKECKDMITARSGIACVSYALYIYAIGGRFNNSEGHLDCVEIERFDPFTNVWMSCTPMSVARSRAGANVIDGLIYAVGGANGSNCHNSVERYYPKEDRWECVSPMRTQRVGLTCVVTNRLLYAIGGFDGNERLNSVEVYNPDNDEWSLIEPMNEFRSGAGSCVVDDLIYVIGGYDGKNQLSSCECYNTITKEWRTISSMLTQRSAFGCVYFHCYTQNCTCILVTGGYDGTNFLTSAEIYNPAAETWSLSENQYLTSERSGHGAVCCVSF